MNIHPFIVHFPVALLTIYSVLEIVRVRVFAEKHWYSLIKKSSLYAGAVGVFFAFATGGIAEGIITKTSVVPQELIERHELFVSTGGWIFIAIAVLYFLSEKGKPLAVRFVSGPLARLMCIAAFALLVVGGALGAAIVHGPGADAIVAVVFKIFSGISVR